VNLRKLAAGQSCVACGAKDETVVAAHYFGPRRYAYGGGLGKKGHDAVMAHLCGRCHSRMDSESRDKDRRWELSEEFLHYCALTWIQLVDQGLLK
jgi:hypothetical protein